MKIAFKMLGGVFAVIAILFLVCFFRVIIFTPKTPEWEAASSNVKVSGEAIDRAVVDLSDSIKLKTVSPVNKRNQDEFLSFIDFVVTRYIDKNPYLDIEIVNDLSLLVKWEPTGTSLKSPIVFVSHYDVVPPLLSLTGQSWSSDPFSGEVSNSSVYGRGALDNKGQVIAQLTALNWISRQQVSIDRPIYLAIGHDEEIGGVDGAKEISKLLQMRGQRPAVVIDEGGVIGDDVMPNYNGKTAFIGIAEKGYLDLVLKYQTSAGHSSFSENESVILKLNSDLENISEYHFPSDWKYMHQLVLHMGEEAPFSLRFIFYNQWLFKPLESLVLASSPKLINSVTTVKNITMFSSGTRANVLPEQATATVNFRLFPGQTADSVHQTIVDLVSEEVTVTKQGHYFNPSNPSVSCCSKSFQLIASAIQSSYEESPPLVLPYLTLASTDSRHYSGSEVLRIMPFEVNDSEIAGIHGINEQIRIDSFSRGIQIYANLMQNLPSISE